jgi:predicted Fe-Mo cluster-binding NifX family protein
VVEKIELLTNPYATLPKARGIRVAEWLISNGTDVVLTHEDLTNKGPGYALANSGVRIRLVRAQTLTEALEATQKI